jgi:hypothetical protein
VLAAKKSGRLSTTRKLKKDSSVMCANETALIQISSTYSKCLGKTVWKAWITHKQYFLHNMKLLPHQEKYASGYKDKAFWVHEGGTGKTICGAVWLRDGRDTDALVICPKRVVKKWGDTLKKWGTCSTVISKDQFKKGIKDGSLLKRWSAIIVDEADEFASPLFTKDRSQLSTALYTLVKTYDMPIALLTATPIRSSPWNLHSLLCYLGDYTDYKAWRKEFFYLQYPDEYQYKFLDRPAYFPNEEWRTQIRAVLEQKADIVLLRDCVDNLPPTEDIIIEMPQRKYEGDRELNPTKRFVLEHQFEQELKPKEILAIGKEYRKVLVWLRTTSNRSKSSIGSYPKTDRHSWCMVRQKTKKRCSQKPTKSMNVS